jgi:transcriptional regulator with XRE-family HTH domain
MPSFRDRLLEVLGDKEPVPNKFTIAFGKAVKKAREDAGLSQAHLGQMIYRRRATISDIENGKSDVTVSTLALLAAALDKPITYFLPWFIYNSLKPEDLEPREHELLIQFRKIWSEDLQQLAVRQVKNIAETDIEGFQAEQRKQLQEITHSNPHE